MTEQQQNEINSSPCIANGGLPFAVRIPSQEIHFEVMKAFGPIHVEDLGDGTANLYHKRR